MTSESEATQNLIKLINQTPDTPQLAWVISGFNEWIRQQPAERCQLDFYLGLSAREAGKYSAATRLQMEMRNFYIREAIREIQQKRGIKRWPAINHILTEISRIKPFVGKRPPKDTVEYNLFQAIALNMDIPTSQVSINDIAKSIPTIDLRFLAQK